jgi:hypothetical protein
MEAFAEECLDSLRTELLQVAAVASSWAQALDKRIFLNAVSKMKQLEEEQQQNIVERS